MADLTLKERLNRRLEGLKDARKGFESDAKEIAAYAQPARSRFLSGDTNKGRQPNRRLNNSHGIFAFRTLQGGMTSGLSSASRPWFNLTTYDENLSEDQATKEWLAECERRMYAFLATTNFYGSVKTGYLEMGLFGTEACVAAEHSTEGMVCHQLTFGEYWLGLGAALTPEVLIRECVMTSLQAVQRFGDAVTQRVRNLYDASRYDVPICFYHAIEKSDEVLPDRMDFRGKPWRSVYWEESDGDKSHVAEIRGAEEQPFWAPRWDTTGSDTWGQGPGHDALPDLRELQLQTKRKAEATDLLVWPEVIVTSKVKLKRQPKAVTNVADIDMTRNPLFPVNTIPYQAVEAIREDVQACKEAINQATYADLFMAITNMAGVQPRNIEEIAARNEEKLTQLGPVIERVNNEKLEVAISRVFGIMQRARLLPPAPDSLRNAPELKVNFISILTQMQRMVGLGPIERTVGFIGNLAAVNPEALDKLNVDEAIDEYAERGGCPPKLIRTDEEVAEIRDSRAQQENAKAMIEAAPAAKDGAQAAALMAEASKGLPVAGAMPL